MKETNTSNSLVFFPATWNLAETTRTLEVAKACRHRFDVYFASYGGQFEPLIEDAGFALTKLSPRLTPQKIEHLYQIDQGEKLGSFFSLTETRERVKNEIAFLQNLRPLAAITGFNTTVTISRRVAKIPLVWLTQSTWDMEAIIDQGLGSYMDDLERPLIRHLPETVLQWLTKRAVAYFSRAILKPLNTVAQDYQVQPLKDIYELWQGDYNLLAEPDDFSGLEKLPQSYYYIGPLIANLDKEIPQAVLEWVNQDKPLVYFSMGSSGRPSVIKAIVEGFREQPFNVISPMQRKTEGLNINVPVNVLLTDWLPALPVNRLADIAVIHGGIGTVMTAALAGKPVVGVGMMYEQEYNLDCLVRKGFAKRIRRTTINPDKINQAITVLLNNPDGKDKAKAYSRHLEKWLNLRDDKIRQFFVSLDQGTLADPAISTPR
ncbi:MAG: glycosyltransferase [Coleofasciculus sp.]